MREVLLMTENCAVAASHGKATCPCWVQFRLMRLIVVLYQAPGHLQHSHGRARPLLLAAQRPDWTDAVHGWIDKLGGQMVFLPRSTGCIGAVAERALPAR